MENENHEDRLFLGFDFSTQQVSFYKLKVIFRFLTFVDVKNLSKLKFVFQIKAVVINDQLEVVAEELVQVRNDIISIHSI